ncbi:hypothetical protein ACODM8_02675 [Vibrio ostreicida]|uniref:hypothetical protein n=1 Tax=Vibrio ostreicida TaxID=526588 RepID=UPI00097113DB|nr:hypothetical protein [Vibrio ostreicida]NPD07500.1 hypothetical protein [Vibrio ostreicida]
MFKTAGADHSEYSHSADIIQLRWTTTLWSEIWVTYFPEDSDKDFICQVLCLDESTRHLDGATIQRVDGNISGLSMTRIMFAHREETMQMADRVIDFSQLNTQSV